MPLKNRLLSFVLLAALAACKKDSVRGLDAIPEVPTTLEFGVIAVNEQKVAPLAVNNTGQIGLQIDRRNVLVDDRHGTPPEKQGGRRCLRSSKQ